MDLQVKKMKLDISATPKKNSKLSPVPITTLKAETNYSFPQLRERPKKTYFKVSIFFKTLTDKCTFLRGPFEQKTFWLELKFSIYFTCLN